MQKTSDPILGWFVNSTLVFQKGKPRRKSEADRLAFPYFGENFVNRDDFIDVDKFG